MTTNDRPLGDVLDALLRQVPSDFEYRAELEGEFNRLKEDASYTAPELMYIRWNIAAEVLNRYLSTPDTDWKQKIDKIFGATEDYTKG